MENEEFISFLLSIVTCFLIYGLWKKHTKTKSVHRPTSSVPNQTLALSGIEKVSVFAVFSFRFRYVA